MNEPTAAIENSSLGILVRFLGQKPALYTPATSAVVKSIMFARKIRVEYEQNGQRLPCPLKWLDSFSMRNFTNASVFDDTLPISDGRMEIGVRVPLDSLQDAMEDWFQRKGYLPKGSKLSVAENT